MKDFAVITAKNEAATIYGLVDALIKSGLNVIVVSDGSTDDTGFIASDAGAHVIWQYPSKGIGASLQAAWHVALDKGADRIIQLDAGGSHDPGEACFLLSYLDRCDIVIGSRFMVGSEYNGRKWRAFASRLAARLMNFAGHTHFTDWTSGYRAFNRSSLFTLADHHYHQTMHAWQMEVLTYAIEKDFRVIEAPITYTAGRSSLRLKTVSDAILEWLWLANR